MDPRIGSRLQQRSDVEPRAAGAERNLAEHPTPAHHKALGQLASLDRDGFDRARLNGIFGGINGAWAD